MTQLCVCKTHFVRARHSSVVARHTQCVSHTLPRDSGATVSGAWLRPLRALPTLPPPGGRNSLLSLMVARCRLGVEAHRCMPPRTCSEVEGQDRLAARTCSAGLEVVAEWSRATSRVRSVSASEASGCIMSATVVSSPREAVQISGV